MWRRPAVTTPTGLGMVTRRRRSKSRASPSRRADRRCTASKETTGRYAVSTASDPWGRVAEDGTVYVRTSGGERQVGSWQAGSPDEALAFFKRKFETLETEV